MDKETIKGVTPNLESRLFIFFEVTLLLEEEITVINNFCVEIKLIHEVTSILHSLLTALLLLSLLIQLHWTSGLVSNLKEINTSIALYCVN